jgi:hypothetical protein
VKPVNRKPGKIRTSYETRTSCEIRTPLVVPKCFSQELWTHVSYPNSDISQVSLNQILKMMLIRAYRYIIALATDLDERQVFEAGLPSVLLQTFAYQLGHRHGQRRVVFSRQHLSMLVLLAIQSLSMLQVIHGWQLGYIPNTNSPGFLFANMVFALKTLSGNLTTTAFKMVNVSFLL